MHYVIDVSGFLFIARAASAKKKNEKNISHNAIASIR